MKKLYSSRIEPLDEWLLIRVASASGTVLMPEMRNGRVVGASTKTLKENVGVVVAIGPGSRNSAGSIVPVDTRIAVGKTVVFPGKVAFQPPDLEKDMQEEGLYFIPASTAICVLHPEGVPAERRSAVLA